MSFVMGDRVQLRPDEADAWKQPLKKFAEEGRAATVVGLPTAMFPGGRYLIQFDTKRANARPVNLSVREVYIQRMPETIHAAQ